MAAEEFAEVNVYCRLRPPREDFKRIELKYTEDGHISLTDDKQVVSKLVNFDFKRVFDEKSSQSEIFQRTALPIYDSVMHGYNGCIITYGQTGSGKTHTITGKTKDIEQMDIKSSKYDKIDFTIKLSIVEIYNDKVYDLLETDHEEELKIKGAGSQSDPFFVEGVTELTTATLRDAMYMVEFSKNQRSKCTEDNSSKSHFVLTLTVIQENVITKISKIGELSFVDLVACERINDPKLLMSRSALQQNSTINKGLSYLSTCIENMANGRKGDFRSCNLTKVLNKYIQGNSMTAFILTCSSEHIHISDTLSTLRFGQQASKLRNRVRMNKELSVEMLKSIIGELEARIIYYQRLEASQSENDRKGQVHNEEAWQQLKAKFDDAVDDRDMLRCQLDKWLDERGEELVQEREKEEKAKRETQNLSTKLSQQSTEIAELKATNYEFQLKNKQLQYSLDQAELKQSSLLEENSSFSIKVLSLEQQLEELQERLHKVMQKDDSQQTPTLKASPTRPSIHNDETKALKRSLDGLRQELERREDWIYVLKEHIKVKDRSLRDIKKAYVDLHSKQQSQIDSLIDKLEALLDDKRLLQKRFLHLCQPNLLPDIRMSVQMDRGMSGKDSPVLDTLKRSQLLYQSIDKTRAWNIGKFEYVRGGGQDSPIQSSLDLNRKNRYLNTINLMPLRSSIGESLYRTSIKSNRKSTTVKKIRGGNTIQQFDPQCEDEDPDEPKLPTTNTLDCI